VKSAALFIMTLEKPVLAEVLKYLSTSELTCLTQGYEQIVGVGTPTDNQLAAVGKKFIETSAVGATTHFKEALVLAFGQESADQILRQDHWRMIAEKVKPESLAAVLKGERPEAVAIALSQLPSKYSADVLASLPDDLKAQSIDYLARSEAFPGTALDAILRAIEESFNGKVGLDQGAQNAGARRAAAMLNQIDSESAAAIVNHIRAGDEARASAIEQEMFHFDDFLKLENRALQRVLGEVKPEKLALALKGTGDAERKVIFEALPDQIQQIITQEMEDSGRVPLRDVRAARREITDIALQMDREGTIRLRSDQDMVA